MKALGCGGSSILNLEVEPSSPPPRARLFPESSAAGVPCGHHVPEQPQCRGGAQLRLARPVWWPPRLP
jgi:hypothetical protein